MDGDRFDTLARSIHEAPSRRGLLRGLAGTALGLAALRLSGVASAKKRRKKKRKKRKRGGSCEPQCNGKDCGNDGCGSSCGSCTGGICQDGVCTCPEDNCGGSCVTYCPAILGQERNPTTCACCLSNRTVFGNIQTPPNLCSPCCSAVCSVNPGATGNRCFGKLAGDGCEFDTQCTSFDCQDTGPGAGTCA